MTSREWWLTVYRAATDLAGRIAMLLLTVVAARRLEPAAFGVFALGTTLGWLASVAADAGVQMHVARTVSRQPHRARSVLSTWLRWRLRTTLAALGVAALLVGSGAIAVPAAPLLILTAGALAGGLADLVHHVFRGLRRSDLESTLGLGQRLGALVIGAGALWLAPDVTTLALACAVPAAVVLGVSLSVVDRVAPDARPAPPPSREAVRREFLREVAPIGVGIVLSALYFRVDIFLVEAWHGAAAVGLYGAVFRLVDALRLFPAAVLAVAFPTLCQATTPGPLARLSSGMTLASAGIAAVAAWAAHPIVALLFGPGFVTAVPAFRVLLIAFPLMTLNYALTSQLLAWTGQRTWAVLCAAALLVNVAANLWAIPAFSIVGAAWTTVGTEAFLTAGASVAVAMQRARHEGVPAGADAVWQEV